MQKSWKPLFFLLILMLGMATLPGTWAVKVNSLEINVEVDKVGSAKVTENYSLSFISELDAEDFKENAVKNASSLIAWQATYDFLKKHIIGETEGGPSSTTIAYEENTRILTLSYSEGTLAELTKQEQRADYFKIDDRKMAAFNESGSITIPENTRITITLPPNTQVDTTNLSPKAKVFGNQVVLQGITSNSMTINYVLNKPILGEGNDLIKGVPNTYIIIALAILIIVAVQLRREDFEKKIEDFIVDHSEIKAKKTSEEIDFDME